MSSSWKCVKCKQLNVGWTDKCGRCGASRKAKNTKIESDEVDGERGPLKFMGYDSAIIGICPDCWDSSGMRPPRIIYSGEKIMEILVSRDGMDHDEAAEWISFNMEGAYFGPTTPIVCWPFDESVYDQL